MTGLSIALSCRNEEDNIPFIFKEIAAVDKLIAINEIVIVDNGSTDDTFKLLQSYTLDPRLKVIKRDDQDSSYSEGLLNALRYCSCPTILTFHSDLQYSPSEFIAKNYDSIIDSINKGRLIIGNRVNRPLGVKIWTYGLITITSFFLKMPFSDFNGQPKIFANKLNIENLNKLRGFSFDIALCYSNLSNLDWLILNSPERPRLRGQSTWKGTFLSRIILTRSYLSELKKIRDQF
jgi:glycosyltransferase involved in cell wall biosynthesis